MPDLPRNLTSPSRRLLSSPETDSAATTRRADRARAHASGSIESRWNLMLLPESAERTDVEWGVSMSCRVNPSSGSDTESAQSPRHVRSWSRHVGPLILVGLDPPDPPELRRRFDRPVLAFETLPRIRVDQ